MGRGTHFCVSTSFVVLAEDYKATRVARKHKRNPIMMELTEKKSIFSSTFVLVLTALLCCALWGSATPAIKAGYALLDVVPELAPDALVGASFGEILIMKGVPSILLFAGTRFALAGLLTVIIFSIARRKLLYPKLANMPKVLTVSVFQTVIQYIFFYLGLAFTIGVKGTVTSGSGAFFAVIIASLIFKQEKFTLKKVIACIVGFAGIVLINFNGLAFTDDVYDIMGVAFVLLSTVSSSFSSVLIKRFSKDEDPVVISGYQFIIGGIFMVIVGLAFGGSINLADLGGVMILVYLAFLSAIAYSLWGLLLKYNPVSRVTVFNFTTPIFGTFLTMLFFPAENSSLSVLNLVITIVLVSLGIFLLNYTFPFEKSAVRCAVAAVESEADAEECSV